MMGVLCCIERWRYKGQMFETWVFQREQNRYTAETFLAPGDRIVSDGSSQDEALQTHLAILPAALWARQPSNGQTYTRARTNRNGANHMTIEVELNRRPGYLSVTLHDMLNLERSRGIIEQVAEVLGSEATPILLDVCDATCQLSYASILSLVTDLGEHRMAFRARIAVLYQDDVAKDAVCFFELCAGNRGYQAGAFTDEQMACQWLIGASEANAS